MLDKIHQGLARGMTGLFVGYIVVETLGMFGKETRDTSNLVAILLVSMCIHACLGFGSARDKKITRISITGIILFVTMVLYRVSSTIVFQIGFILIGLIHLRYTTLLIFKRNDYSQYKRWFNIETGLQILLVILYLSSVVFHYFLCG